MTILLKQLYSLIRLLNSDRQSKQIAAGIVCGWILGLSPVFSLQSAIVVVALFFFRIQFGAALIAAVFFKIPAVLLDPVFDQIGRRVLEIGPLHGVFTALYNLPIIPFSRFNNSIVMGSGVVAIVLAPLIYRGSEFLVEKYREAVVSRFQGTRLWKVFRASSFYGWYSKYEQFRQ